MGMCVSVCVYVHPLLCHPEETEESVCVCVWVGGWVGGCVCVCVGAGLLKASTIDVSY